mgnify:CR=1 FL=1
MLEKYEKLTKEIEEKEAALEKEEEELKTLQNDLIAKRNSVNQLLAEKEVQISSLEDQIGANAAKLQELIKEAEEAKRRQEEAAAAKRAAEEAARKAALAAQQAASSSGSSSGSGSFQCREFSCIWKRITGLSGCKSADHKWVRLPYCAHSRCYQQA